MSPPHLNVGPTIGHEGRAARVGAQVDLHRRVQRVGEVAVALGDAHLVGRARDHLRRRCDPRRGARSSSSWNAALRRPVGHGADVIRRRPVGADVSDVQEAAGGLGRLDPPPGDDVGRDRRPAASLQAGEDRRERGELGPRELGRGCAEHDLEQELGAHVARVRDRAAQPVARDAPALRGRAPDRARRARARLRAPGLDQLRARERVERSVGERAGERPHPADLAVGGERLHDRPAVARLARHQREAHGFREAELGARPITSC